MMGSVRNQLILNHQRYVRVGSAPRKQRQVTALKRVVEQPIIAAGQSLAKILGRNQCTVSLACNERLVLFCLFCFLEKELRHLSGYDTYKSEFVEDGMEE